MSVDSGSPIGGEAARKIRLSAIYQPVPDGYIGFIEELSGANAQAASLEEVRENLHEAARLVLEANRSLLEESLEGAEVIREPLLISDE